MGGGSGQGKGGGKAAGLGASGLVRSPTAYVELCQAPSLVDAKEMAFVPDEYELPRSEEASEIDERDKGTPDEWVPRKREMLRLTGNHPFNSEPPLPVLMEKGFFTPASLHYVRNHGPVPKLAWETHRVQVHDLDGSVVGELSMHDLTTKFPLRTVSVTLTCAGNRRMEQNVFKQSKGFSWGCGAASTSIWTGVRMSDILEHFGLLSEGNLQEAKYVCFEGVDDLPNGAYGTSLTMDTALDPARDVLLAFEQNGERLLPDHGFPVRVLIPGFIGGRSVKWLGKLGLSRTESTSWYHYFDNRLLPSHVDQEVVKKDDSWFKDPRFIINDRNINSVISSPAHNELLVLNRASPTYTMRGYAYNGGGRKITRVEVSFDSGRVWELASIDQAEKPTSYGRHWCWTLWSMEIDPKRLLESKEVAVRAWDESTNTQPGNLTWSILGMMNNPWFRVKIAPVRTEQGLALHFKHPATIEDQGGWMVEEAPTVAPVQDAAKAAKAEEALKALPSFTLAQVAEHVTAEDCWIVIDGKVFDVTNWLKDHPGGATSIVGNAGKDTTKFFNAIHSQEAREMLADWLIGTVAAEPSKL